jgi:hypothetical protein
MQHEIVIGTLLGDGSMRCKTNALLEINHSADQSGYVEWKYRQLADLVSEASRCGSWTMVSLEERGVPEHAAVRLAESGAVAPIAPRAVEHRRDPQPRQDLSTAYACRWRGLHG